MLHPDQLESFCDGEGDDSVEPWHTNRRSETAVQEEIFEDTEKTSSLVCPLSTFVGPSKRCGYRPMDQPPRMLLHRQTNVNFLGALASCVFPLVCPLTSTTPDPLTAQANKKTRSRGTREGTKPDVR